MLPWNRPGRTIPRLNQKRGARLASALGLPLCTVLSLAGCYDFSNPYEQGCGALVEQVVYQESFDSYNSGTSAGTIGLIENVVGE